MFLRHYITSLLFKSQQFRLIKTNQLLYKDHPWQEKILEFHTGILYFGKQLTSDFIRRESHFSQDPPWPAYRTDLALLWLWSHSIQADDQLGIVSADDIAFGHDSTTWAIMTFFRTWGPTGLHVASIESCCRPINCSDLMNMMGHTCLHLCIDWAF